MEIIEKSLAAIESSDDDKFGPNGGFTAILSNESLDRDQEIVDLPGWMPFQDRYPLDFDHEMSVAGTIGSYHPYIDGKTVMMDAYFSSIPKAQEVRTLVKEGHIRNVSVAFMTDRTKKDGPRREMLNAGIVAIPANRDAVIMAAKAASLLKERVEEGVMTPNEVKAALGLSEGQESLSGAESKDAPKPYGDVRYADPEDGKYPIDTVAHIRAALAYINMPRNYEALGDHAAHVKAAIEAAARAHGIHVDGKSVDGAEVKAPQGQSAGSGDRAMLQAIHDASVHMGAVCVIPMQGDEDPTGASDGANKSVSFTHESGQQIEFATNEDAREFFADMLKSLDDAQEAGEELVEVTQETKLESFAQALDVVLTPEESPADSPAVEAAAASVEEPAPADEAADNAADQLALEADVLRTQLALLA